MKLGKYFNRNYKKKMILKINKRIKIKNKFNKHFKVQMGRFMEKNKVKFLKLKRKKI